MFFRSILLSLFLAVAGCATAPSRIEGSAGSAELEGLQQWRASGRIGVVTQENGGSGSFNWQQQGGDSSVQLSGPAGIGSVQLHLNGDSLEVQTGNGQSYQAQAALDELQLRLGAAVPPAKLRYWLMGLAAPGDYRWLDDAKSVLEQDGWRIEYSEFLSQNSVRLPARITAINGATRVRILVERWRLGA